MKMLMTKKHFGFIAVTAAMGIAMIFGTNVGCAKKRDAVLPEDLQKKTFSIDELRETSFSVSTREGVPAASSTGQLSEETSTVVLDPTGVPDRMKFMFKNLEVLGQKKSADIRVVFGVDRQAVTAYKVAAESDLSVIEKSIAITSNDLKSLAEDQKLDANQLIEKRLAQSKKKNVLAVSNSIDELLIPIFKFKIQAHGKIETVKNDMKENTSNLKLAPTEWAEATHVQISDLSHDRVNVEIDSALKADLENYYVASKVDQKIASGAQVKSMLGEDVKVEATSSYIMKMDGKNLQVLEIVAKDGALEPSVKEHVQECTEAVTAALADSSSSCALLSRWETEWAPAQLRISSDNGTISSKENTRGLVAKVAKQKTKNQSTLVANPLKMK